MQGGLSIKAMRGAFNAMGKAANRLCITQPKDLYDLDFILQANGYSEAQAKQLCDLIDSKGRAPLHIRKLIGRIVNRQYAHYEDIRELRESVPHIFKSNTNWKLLRQDKDCYHFFIDALI